MHFLLWIKAHEQFKTSGSPAAAAATERPSPPEATSSGDADDQGDGHDEVEGIQKDTVEPASELPVGSDLRHGDFADYPDGEGFKRVQKYILSTMSAWLTAPPGKGPNGEEAAPLLDADPHPQLDPSYRPERGEFDANHPCARPVTDLLNKEKYFSFDFVPPNPETPEAPWGCCCDEVRFDQRDILLAVNMHTCTDSCHKYGHFADCRFGFPLFLTPDCCCVMMETTMDRHSRIRQKIYAPRNNHFINRYAAKPQVVCCWRGNCDFTFVTDPWGAGVYCCCYVSKSEEPDSKVLCNVLARSLTHPGMNPTRRDVLRKMVTALLSSVVVGATQAVWSLLQFAFVTKSRKVIHVSTAPAAQLAQKMKNLRGLKAAVRDEGPAASAFEDAGPNSHLGRRNAYSALVKKQQELIRDSGESVPANAALSFHALLSSYHVTSNPNYVGLNSVTCARDHVLKKFKTKEHGFTCESCSAVMPVKSILYGCRACDFDLCESCVEQTRQRKTAASYISDDE